MTLCPESPKLTSDLLISQQNPIILRYQSSLVPSHQTGLHRLLIVHGECALCRQQLPDPAVTHGLSLLGARKAPRCSASTVHCSRSAGEELLLTKVIIFSFSLWSDNIDFTRKSVLWIGLNFTAVLSVKVV